MKRFLATISVFLIVLSSHAQDRRPVFLGFSPQLTKEDFYDKGEFDLNVIPIVFQVPVTHRVDFRLSTLVNYRFGGKSHFSDLGINLSSPVYFKKKESILQKSQGLFISPYLGISRNVLDLHTTINLAGQAGYSFLLGEKFGMSMHLEYGATRFIHDELPEEWGPHFGFKVNLGWWF